MWELLDRPMNIKRMFYGSGEDRSWVRRGEDISSRHAKMEKGRRALIEGHLPY